jgi:hypothetical protein
VLGLGVTVAEQPGSGHCPVRAPHPKTTEINIDAALHRLTHSLFLDQTEIDKQFKDAGLSFNVVRELVKQMIGENPAKSP